MWGVREGGCVWRMYTRVYIYVWKGWSGEGKIGRGFVDHG